MCIKCHYISGWSVWSFLKTYWHGEGPWSTQLNLNVAYVPSWADGKLTLQADIINVLNKQTAGSYNPRYENGSAADRRNTPNKFYGQEIQISAPRSLRLTARYDF